MTCALLDRWSARYDSSPVSSKDRSTKGDLPSRAPFERDGKYVLEVGNAEFEVDPAVGARITRYALAGRNVLMPLSDQGSWTNGGSTFWTSPQRDWDWPPPEAMDRARYAAELVGDTIVMTSQPILVGESTLVLEKRFRADLEHGAIDIEYTIENRGPALALAGWEISRVQAKGLTFFAGSAPEALGGQALPPTQAGPAGVVWLDHAAQTSEGKLGADGTAGYVAYADEGLLFLKTFEDVPPGAAAEGEAEIEIYVKPGEYVEVEQQSALVVLDRGQRSSYSLKWYLRAMDEGVVVEVGSQSLLEFAKGVRRPALKAG